MGMKCDKCGTEMIMANQGEIVERIPLDASEMGEGQMADYMAAELAGEMGEWEQRTGVIETIYVCPKCQNVQRVYTSKDDPKSEED